MELETTGFRDRREFCSIVNAVIRLDHAEVMRPAAVFARCINEVLIQRSIRCGDNLQIPASGILWRGSTMPDKHQTFFTQGVKYRAPGFLATSASLDVANRFLYKVIF